MHAEGIIDALILGVIEGLTEFLPVSSTAHLLLASRLLGFESAGKAFEVLIQLGAILALLAVYSGKIVQILRDLPHDRRTQRFVLGVLIAFLPAAILGVAFHRVITEVLFESPVIICIALILGGIVLLFIDRLAPTPREENAMDYPLPVCLGIGLFQCLSLIPGVSRSGATIVGALILGGDKRSAAEFSFFLAMPTMLGAFVYDLYKNIDTMDANAGILIAIGFVAAFISAVIVVRSFVGFVGRHGFAMFGWWRIVVGVIGLIAVLFFSGQPAGTTFARSEGAALVELAAGPKPLEVGRQDSSEAGRVDAEAFDGAALGPRRL
jgi:undecaprenyl-diphosphatase